uniref:Uncharacterized protein n=1 Tax=Arundo donax TaxID=35708 RepID=A0A0A9G7V2_ARUDO
MLYSCNYRKEILFTQNNWQCVILSVHYGMPTSTLAHFRIKAHGCNVGSNLENLEVCTLIYLNASSTLEGYIDTCRNWYPFKVHF